MSNTVKTRRDRDGAAALRAFGDAIADIVLSRWCPECLGTRAVVVAGVEEDCDYCDARGVLPERAAR